MTTAGFPETFNVTIAKSPVRFTVPSKLLEQSSVVRAGQEEESSPVILFVLQSRVCNEVSPEESNTARKFD